MRRRILVFTAVATMMALMIGAGSVPAVASSNQYPHKCVDLGGGTLCQHRVSTPSGIQNGQDQFRGDFFAHEGGAVVSTSKAPGEFVSHSTIAPSGNFNTTTHQNPPEE